MKEQHGPIIAFKHWDQSEDGLITVAEFKLRGTLYIFGQ